MNALKYATDFRYADRAAKAQYVWLKYRPILEGARILDVGADECHLRKHLPSGASYWGIGLGGTPDQQVDLESGRLPFDSNSFDVVLCLDVLEHLEKIHAIFDECSRVASRHFILSLPNPLGDLYSRLTSGAYAPGRLTKFYGLPLEPPEDRHRWFFAPEEAEAFIRHRAKLAGMDVAQIDSESVTPERRPLRRFALRALLRGDFDAQNLFRGSTWAALEKKR